MNFSTVLPVDKNGNPVPVFIPDTSKTQSLAIADATTCAPSTAFSGSRKIMSSFTTDDIFSGTNTMTFTSKLDGYPSNSISITIQVGSAVGVSLSGYDIVISHFDQTPKCSEIKALMDANSAISKLVSVEHTDGDATFNTSGVSAKTYLSGWDNGDTPVIVRVAPTANGFMGIATGALLIANLKMPLFANMVEYVALMPNEVITVVGAAAVTGAKVYLTPARMF